MNCLKCLVIRPTINNSMLVVKLPTGRKWHGYNADGVTLCGCAVEFDRVKAITFSAKYQTNYNFLQHVSNEV